MLGNDLVVTFGCKLKEDKESITFQPVETDCFSFGHQILKVRLIKDGVQMTPSITGQLVIISPIDAGIDDYGCLQCSRYHVETVAEHNLDEIEEDF